MAAPYRRRDIIFQSAPTGSEFAAQLGELGENSNAAQGVEVAGVKQSSRPPRKIFDSNHPDANPEGYVSLPDINSTEEMPICCRRCVPTKPT